MWLRMWVASAPEVAAEHLTVEFSFTFCLLHSDTWTARLRRHEQAHVSPRRRPAPPACAGRGARFDSGLTMAQGGSVEPRYCPSLETKFG